MPSLESIRFAQEEATGRASNSADVALVAHRRADAEQRDAPTRAQWECRAACAFCCHLVVVVKRSEADLIAAHLASALDVRERAALRGVLRDRAVQASRLDAGSYRRLRLRCAFLGPDRLCTVYEVRPVKCRVHVSRRAAACEDVNAPVPFDTWLSRVGEAIHQGMEDGETVELHAAVEEALQSHASI